MKIQAGAAVMLAMAASGWGGESVQVCVNSGNVASVVLLKAEDAASHMFATAGVQIAWRCGTRHSVEAIVVDFAEQTAPNDHPGAMAYARPYEGVHIVVLYDRMQRVPGRLLPVLLAHVLVHEVTHLLEAVPHHSATGIMKARWDSNDYKAMLRAPLPFAAEDLDMIQHGIEAREARAKAGFPAAVAIVADRELP